MSNPRKMQHERGGHEDKESRERMECAMSGGKFPMQGNSVSLVLMTPLGVEEQRG